MGTLNQDSVWDAREGSERKWGVCGVERLCSGLSPCVWPGGMILECPRGFWKPSEGLMMRVIGQVPGWR